MIDIVVEGDAISAAMAQREIEAIVNEKTSTANFRMRDVPAEYYPFLHPRIADLENGRDIKVQIPHYHTFQGAPPPLPTAQGPVKFVPQPSLPITISGDRLAAQQAREQIEGLVRSLATQITSREEEIERGRHQFIVGDRGFSAQDFLAETGCALIKPPLGQDSDSLYIVGPADKIEDGYEKMMELANQMHSLPVHVNKTHAKAQNGGPEHTRNMARYFQQKKALEELEQLHTPASISVPASGDGHTSWDVYAKDYASAKKLEKDIMALIGAHPPSRIGTMDVDPFFQQRIQQRQAAQIRRDHGVHIVFPDGHVEHELLLVYEAPGSPSGYSIPRQACSAAEAREQAKAIRAVQEILAAITGQHGDIVSRGFDAQPKFHDKLRRYVEREQQGLGEDQFPIQLLFGQGGRQPSIRGPSSAVDDFDSKIRAFLEQEAHDEAERGFTTSFDYPQKFANFLIGKRGENIMKLREEFDVEIQVKDGKVELKGPEKKCAAAKSRILSQLKKFEDETTHTLKIKPQFHRELIGGKGATVLRLQDRHNVRINFPRNAPPTDDNATEGSVKNFRSQAPDEVIIKGPKKGADDCRSELLELLQYVTENSSEAFISVQQSQLPQLIGSQGREIEQLRLDTGCSIDTPREGADAKGRVQIKLRGTKKQVEDAKKVLEARVKTFDDTITTEVNVDRKHHRNLIGSGGKLLSIGC